MLSIGAMKSGQANYYTRLAVEDYYLSGGEPPGSWLGRGSQELKLEGTVKADELSTSFLGFGIDGAKLVQNAGKANRQPGWDLTFSAPKSVSVLWSQSEAREQSEIQKAQASAVTAAIAFLEENFSFSRLGQGGIGRVPASLVVAAFEHSSSRALDPQLHTHCLVMNLGVGTDGAVRSILSRPFYAAKMLAGAFYRAELSAQLKARLGIETERPLGRDGRPVSWFEVKGIPERLLSHFSKRRAAIEKELGRQGMESASAAAYAALSTREAKAIVPPRQELHEGWRREGRELGFTTQDIFRKVSESAVHKQEKLFKAALLEAVKEITFSENFFTLEELIRRTLETSQGLGLSARFVSTSVVKELNELPLFVSLGIRNGRELWTTSEVLAVEKEFLQSVETLASRHFHGVRDDVVGTVLKATRGEPGRTFRLDEEQSDAVRYIAQGNESVKVITGFAGTGKTDMLAAAKEALEQGGYRVLGAALAGVATRTLQEKTGIESRTVRTRELQLYRNLTHTLKHHAEQLLRAAVGKSTQKLRRLTVDEKTVLVLDEAGMIGTRDFALLTKAIVEQGGSIVCVGDQWQLSSIERGGCLGTLAKKIKGVHLTEIRRQEDVKDRNAVKAVLEGKPEEALWHYAEKGQLYVGRSFDDTEERLIRDWTENGGTKAPSEHRIFASTHAEVNRLNELAQRKRVEAGEVDAEESVAHDGRRFMIGDKVRFNTLAKGLQIKKGETGTVIACKDSFSGKYVAVRLHGEEKPLSARVTLALRHHAEQLIRAALGKRTEKLRARQDVILVPLKSLNPLAKTYEGLSLDYCMTTHLGQGQTVKNSYVRLGGRMTDREFSYVQVSRHREKLFLYAEERDAGKTLSTFSRAHCREAPRKDNPLEVPDYSALTEEMRLSRAKELAHATQIREEREALIQYDDKIQRHEVTQ